MTLEEKIATLKARFAACPSQDDRYQLLMDLGKELPKYPAEEKKDEHLVRGCQSRTYLLMKREGDVLHFSACSDALLSAGLVALLVGVYSGEKAETILRSSPTFLTELGIAQSLSMSRANGLQSMHLRMKQLALSTVLNRS